MDDQTTDKQEVGDVISLYIEPDAFMECRHRMLFVYPDSYAKEYAEERDILFSEV